MALLDRLLNLEDPKIPTHQFMAALAEYKRGAIAKQNVVDAFDLSIDEATALQAWLDNLDSDTVNRAMIHDILLLGEVGLYSKAQVQSRLSI